VDGAIGATQASLLADRLDPVDGARLVDDGDHFLNGRSSSAWAKYADALRRISRRISFAWRNSRISRSSALIRSRSSLVGPARLPWSRSACRTQPRSPLAHRKAMCCRVDSASGGCAKDVSAVQPIVAAIEPIAAHCEACSPACSNTIRTARSRTSGEYFGEVCFVMMTPVLCVGELAYWNPDDPVPVSAQRPIESLKAAKLP
jgi:hypothetical protein